MKLNTIKPFLPSIDEIYDDFKTSLETGMVTNNSPKSKELETKLKEYFNSTQTPLLFCNGELALFNLIQAHKLKLGYSTNDTFDVLVPSLTFSGTLNAILMNNLKPVFCDVDETLTIDIDKCVADTNIKMMVVVGAYGNLPNLDKIYKFSKDNNLVVIFDNAPAFGAKFNNKFVSEYGYSEIYSFHASKIFTTMEGGAAVINDKDVWEYTSRLRDFGQYEKVRGNIDVPGLNGKMQEISAIVGIKNLEKIDFILESRLKNVEKYHTFFKASDNVKLFDTMTVNKNVLCSYLYYPIILKEDATNFVEYMQQHGIIVRRYYTAVHTLDLYRNKYKQLNLDYTESIKDRLVAIPIHTIMLDEDIEYLFTTIEKYFKQ